MKYKDYSLATFGRLKPIRRIGKNKRGVSLWECLCDCGKICIRNTSSLQAGHSRSCGCIRKEVNIKHGLFGTHIYMCWDAMKARCYRITHKGYKYYGGKGIRVCKEWKHNPAKFAEWAIEHGYIKGLFLDRIHNHKGYCPDNCRWVTRAESNKNKTNNYSLEYKGTIYTFTDLVQYVNIISIAGAWGRVQRGWDPLKAATTPKRHNQYC